MNAAYFSKAVWFHTARTLLKRVRAAPRVNLHTDFNRHSLLRSHDHVTDSRRFLCECVNSG